MRVAVTGANGFLGGAVCERLVEDGHDVRSIVRRAGSSPAGTDEFLIDDICDTTSWPEALSRQDALVHLAAHAHMRNAPETAIDQFRRVNTEATLRLAAAAARCGIQKLVFMSSIAAHGATTDSAPVTLDQPSEPRTPYGKSKLEAEEGLRGLASPTMSVACMRVPLVYGPQAPGNFARLLSLVEKRIPLPLGSVRNRRTLISQWNLADALTYELSSASSEFRLVQVADSEPISTPDLIRAIARGLGTRARLFPVPPSLLRWLGRVAKRSDEVDRLAGSLEVRIGSSDPGFDWWPSRATEVDVQLAAGLWHERQQLATE